MNWGHKIIIVFAIFVSLVMFAVYTATNHPTDLVAEDYYKQELEYQQRIDKINHTLSKEYEVNIEEHSDVIRFLFPETLDKTKISGQVLMFRPSNELLDKIVNIALDSNNGMQIHKSQLKKGRYKVMIEWDFLDEEFFQETELFVQ